MGGSLTGIFLIFIFNYAGMIDNFDFPISDIVKKDYRTADVFKKYQLGFCCGVPLSLRTACDTKGLDFEMIVAELKEATRDFTFSNSLAFDEWTLDFLVEFITNIHHAYIYRATPDLSAALNTFTQGHQSKYPELPEITSLFQKLADLLMIHNRHEDEIIFPYIKQVYSAFRRKESYGNLFVRTLRKPIHLVETENQKIRDVLDSLATLTNRFQAPESACLTYKVIFKKLDEFCRNLIQHHFLETKHLFPKALATEQQLLQ